MSKSIESKSNTKHHVVFFNDDLEGQPNELLPVKSSMNWNEVIEQMIKKWKKKLLKISS